MSVRHYRLLPAFAASISLLAAALTAGLLAGCGSERTESDTGGPRPVAAQVASKQPDEIDTESTIWTVLGMAKRPSQRNLGPQTGDQVSPIIWEAAHDALSFVKIASEDPLTGVIQTDWYSPAGKPNERLRINVFILSRALRSDSVSVSVEREQRTPSGQWGPSTIAKDAVAELETAVLLRARHIRAERYREKS
jgi:Domain of unknown function (DUF3576)